MAAGDMILTTAEAAAALGVEIETLNRAVRHDHIGPIVRAGRRWFDEAALARARAVLAERAAHRAHRESERRRRASAQPMEPSNSESRGA